MIQRHSIPIDVELARVRSSEELFYETGKKYIDFIDWIGIILKSRLLNMIWVIKHLEINQRIEGKNFE